MSPEKTKKRLAFLINEAEQRIKESEKSGDKEMKWYYQGSLYSAKMMLIAMDCSIKLSEGKKIIVDDILRKNV